MTGHRQIEPVEEPDLDVPEEDMGNITEDIDDTNSEDQRTLWLSIQRILQQAYGNRRLTPDPVRIGFLNDEGELITSPPTPTSDDGSVTPVADSAATESSTAVVVASSFPFEGTTAVGDTGAPVVADMFDWGLAANRNNADVNDSAKGSDANLPSNSVLSSAELELYNWVKPKGKLRMGKVVIPKRRRKPLIVDELDIAKEKRRKSREEELRRRKLWLENYCNVSKSHDYYFDEDDEYYYDSDSEYDHAEIHFDSDEPFYGYDSYYEHEFFDLGFPANL